MTTHSNSLDWVREVPAHLQASDEIPLIGNSPPFPWAQLALKLGDVFERKGLTIEVGEVHWRSKEQLFEGLGDALVTESFVLPPLRGEAFWVMAEQEVLLLESLLLTKEPHPISFQDPSLTESFYRFFILELLYQMTQLPFDPSLAPVLMKQTPIPFEDSLALDLTLKYEKYQISGRLLVSLSLRQAWVDHFAQHPAPPSTKRLAETAAITVSLVAGKTRFSIQEWASLSEGDFLLLDECGVDLDSGEGKIYLQVGTQPFFAGEWKKDGIEILEQIHYQKVDHPMVDAEDHEEEVEEEDFSEIEESLTDEDVEDLSGFEDEDQEEHEEEHLEPNKESASPEKRKVVPSVVAGSSENKVEEKPVSLKQIPLEVCVEVGRIELSLEKFLNLQPGNLLNLDIHPEEGVNLTVHGKTVAKGELIRLGELLGVRILRLPD